jgi:hypothetical protein
MLGIVLLCVKFGAAQQEINLDGFVTDPPSEHFLKVSKFTINVSPDTQCSRYEPEYGRYFFINKTTLIAESCDKSNVSVGSRVTVVGELTTSDTVRASKILVGESFERPTSLPKTDGERLDWRLDDRYSGAPWEHTEGGGAFVEEGPETSTPQAPIIAHWWINGFPLTITSATTTFLRSKRSSTDSMLFMPNNMGGVLIDNHRKVRAPTFPLPQTRLPLYVSYEASRGDHEEPVATDLHLYSYDAVRGEQKFVDGYRASVQEPDYAKHLDGKIQYKDGAEIEIIADEHLQNYVCGGLKEVIPETWRTQDPFRNLLRCFVVKPFKNVPGKFYEQFNGEPTVWTRGRSTNGDLVYKVPAGVSSIDQVIAMPDGLILIPDSELPRFQNKAQLEFVLSAAVTAIVQRAAYFIRREDSADPAPSTMDGYDELQKIIRLAIRQMYLSGYDIREAPFAWALATGAKSQNPILNATSNDDIPWYASYAFDYMSRYYRNVDYTALKRDEAEYQHFLKDLHSSDPGAFTSKPVE